jgi:hypothetical protein
MQNIPRRRPSMDIYEMPMDIFFVHRHAHLFHSAPDSVSIRGVGRCVGGFSIKIHGKQISKKVRVSSVGRSELGSGSGPEGAVTCSALTLLNGFFETPPIEITMQNIPRRRPSMDAHGRFIHVYRQFFVQRHAHLFRSASDSVSIHGVG